MVLPSATSTAPSVHFTYPPSSLFNFAPFLDTQALTPVASDRSLTRPFNVNPEIYNSALHFAVPATIALVYATTVHYMNGVNRRRDHKPWPFSKSFAFYAFVIVHNLFLAVFSGWTFIGMVNAITHSWPGLKGEYGLAGAADALCKMHGPRGLGSAATYGMDTSSWGFTDRTLKLAGNIPDPTDVGRIWNEGLAFYGWLFYLSKFYEVFDTAIILSKGKKSSILQTYHHTGAMLCMWAGIRYMSPPIWMFVFINSGLHTIMYAYYTLNALAIDVPGAVKRTLTTLQIIQIIFGAFYAFAHLFVAYDIPGSQAYRYVHNLSTALPSTASSVSFTLSSALSSATAAAGFGSWIKKAALRAAGEEGLAENVRNYQGETFGIDAVHAAEVEKSQEEIRYRMTFQKVHCLDTSGQVLAILMNLVYLAPLVYLFLNFFYRSYTSRSNTEPPKPSQQENVRLSSEDAVKDIEREIQEAVDERQGGATEPPPEWKAKLEDAKQNAKESGKDIGEKVQANAKDLGTKAQNGASDLSAKAKDAAGDLPAKAQNGASDLSDKAKDAVGDIPAKAQNGASDFSAKAKDSTGDLPAKAQNGASDLSAKAKDAAGDLPAKAQNGASDLSDKAKDAARGLPAKAQEGAGGLSARAKDAAGDLPAKAQNGADDLGAKTKNPVKDAKDSFKDDLQALQERMKKMGGEEAKPKSSSDDKAEETGDGKGKSDGDVSKPAETKKSEKDDTKKGQHEDTKMSQNEDIEDQEEGSEMDGDAMTYEVVPDEPKTAAEKKAEESMQPKQS